MVFINHIKTSIENHTFTMMFKRPRYPYGHEFSQNNMSNPNTCKAKGVKIRMSIYGPIYYRRN